MLRCGWRRAAKADDTVAVCILLCVQIGETPFYIAVDHGRRAVVISIRGTLSLQVSHIARCVIARISGSQLLN